MKTITHNVAALDQVLGLATPVYDSHSSGNASIERTALTALLEESKKSVSAVHKAKADHLLAINKRQEAFAMLPQLGMHIFLHAECNGMNDKDLADLDALRKRFRGQPFKSGKSLAAKEMSEDVENVSTRKNRQLSFVQKVGTLEAIINLLDGHPAYPTDAEWSVDALKVRLAELQQHNITVGETRGLLTQARTKAKGLVFNRRTGILGIARMTKRYLRLILGANADLYKSISRIKFKSQ